jgi:hypothetical protein
MRVFGVEGTKGLAVAGAILVASCLGCTSRVLGDLIVGGDGGRGGSGGDGGDTGGGGTGGTTGAGGADAGGRGGGWPTGSGGIAGSDGTAGSSGDPCVISCGPVACPVRAGQPRVLVTSPVDQIGAIAVGADTLYWGTYPSVAMGEIRSMPLAGGPSKRLVDNVVVTELYLDGATLYYVTSNRRGTYSLFAVPATGGTSQLIATGVEIRSLTADASGIYFGQGGPGIYGITRVDRSGSGMTTIVAGAGTLWGFAVDETNIYWALYANGGALYRRSLAGGELTMLRASSTPITSPVADGDEIVFVEGISTPDTCRSSLWSIAKTGAGAPRLISPGTSGIDVWRPVRDDTHLYWGRSSRAGAILRTVKGQTPELLAIDQLSVGPLIVGPTDVYWISGTGSAFEVRTVAK